MACTSDTRKCTLWPNLGAPFCVYDISVCRHRHRRKLFSTFLNYAWSLIFPWQTSWHAVAAGGKIKHSPLLSRNNFASQQLEKNYFAPNASELLVESENELLFLLKCEPFFDCYSNMRTYDFSWPPSATGLFLHTHLKTALARTERLIQVHLPNYRKMRTLRLGN